MVSVELESLVGEHVLDGVDPGSIRVPYYGKVLHDVATLRFRLDGVLYEAQEDPEDNYRSSLQHLIRLDGDHIDNAFTPCRVVGRMREDGKYSVNNTLELVDVVTGKVVLAVGTDNTDDYYPECVMMFDPSAMASNN